MNLFLNFEHYILAIQMVDVSKIGDHINIQISYKILWLGLFKTLSFLGFLVCFQKRLFSVKFHENMGKPLGVKLFVQS